MEMSSRLVETMMINVEDFADSFLTCGTCLSGYDSASHSAKLLPCSHTVCRTCLERILETQKSMAECEAEEDTMRCPICRETIIVPRGGGGAATFPPAFIVNQLLDLMASQRRDRVPKCRRHPGQELLFCETCDVIFCPDCRGGNTRSHATEACGGTDPSGGSVGSSGAALSHNVISFSVAIKRCSEILLYKASLCVQELNSAQEAVTAELQRLSESSEACIAAAESSFEEIRALVERRQAEVIQNIQRKSEEKHRALEDQLALIESERSLVREQCDQLNSLTDVRSISKGISYLNDKLDTIASLTEPRENAFLRYEDDPHVASETAAVSDLPTTTSNNPQPGSAGFVDIARCLAAFGRITVSTTYPPLCTANLPEEMHVHLSAKVLVQAYDYHGEPQTTGKDPISVHFKDPNGREVSSVLVDNGDGSYEITLCPVSAGPHTLAVNILSRPIRGSPYTINVRGRQKPQWSIVDGPDSRSLIQPFAVAVLQSESTTHTDDSNISGVSVLLLDTGNSRLLVADAETGEIKSVLTGNDALKGQAATGMTLCPEGLWVVNWRANELMLLNLGTNEIVDRIKSPQFMEPTSVCYCPHTGRVLVADNGAGCVFACQNGEVHPIIGGGGSSVQATANSSGSMRGTRKFERYVNDALRRVTGICVMSSGEIVLAAGSELRIYSSKGTSLGTLYAPLSSGSLGLQPQPNPQPSTPIGSEIDSEGTCLPSALTQTSTPLRTVSCLAGSSSGNGGLSSAPGSTLALGSLRHSVGGSLIRPTSTMSSANTTTSSALRGLFGGVSATQTSTDLGECLLASHTDRSRSAVIVFPEFAWRGAITEPVENDDDGGDNGGSGSGGSGEELGASLMRQTRKQAYALEVEPGLRRLAGLAALPQGTPFSSSSHPCLVAVDLGGQSAYCLRFV